MHDMQDPSLTSLKDFSNELIYKCMYPHGTITKTGITRKKIPCYLRNSACRWQITENEKIF